MALGATRPTIALDVLRSSLVDTAAGLALGTAVVAAARRHLGALAEAAAGWPPGAAVHGIALAGVAALAVASALQPALHATKLAPAAVLTDDAGA